MVTYSLHLWKTMYSYIIERMCLYLLIEFSFFMLFCKAVIKVISYFYGSNIESESNTILGILLLICYAINSFFPNIRTIIIDGILKIYFHRYFLIYTKYTEKFITSLADKFSILFLILMSIYLPIVILYYLDVIYFQYNINMGLTIQLYFSLYLIRTFIFLPTYIFGIISTHPRSDELFLDFFSRNPHYLKMVMPVLGVEAGPAMRRLADKALEQALIIMERYPTAGSAAGAAAITGSAAAAAAHHHSQHQQDRIRVITEDENTFREKIQEQCPIPRSVYAPETFASQLEMSKAGTAAKINTDTGPSAAQDSLWAFFKKEPNSVQKYQEAADNSKQAFFEAATKAASKTPSADSVKQHATDDEMNAVTDTVNSVKEFSFQDLYVFFMKFFT